MKNHYKNSRIVLLNSVSDELLATLYENALALLYPSLYEGFGLPIVEAMSMGTPVITSNCSSMCEVAGDAAILIDPYNTNQLAEAMIKIIQDVNESVRLKELGYKRVRLFSWDNAAFKVCNLYNRILSEQ